MTLTRSADAVLDDLRAAVLAHYDGDVPGDLHLEVNRAAEQVDRAAATADMRHMLNAVSLLRRASFQAADEPVADALMDAANALDDLI